ncbi:MAG: cobyric acid synthase [Victivallales bacterium]|nr:cobyric acid synthase [Victivallales bacterium]
MYQHGGDIAQLARRAGCAAEDVLDLSANINPLGPPPWLRSQVNRHLADVANYPSPRASELTAAIARAFGIEATTVVAGNGSSELLYAILRALAPERAIIPCPAYGDYAVAAELGGADVLPVILSLEDGFAVDFEALASLARAGDVLVLGRPVNPTGTVPPAARIRQLAAELPKCTLLVDEAFADFLGDEDTLLGGRPPNVVVLRSMTKFYGIPGLRLGFAVADDVLAEAFRRQIPPWSVNTLARSVGIAALQDTGYAKESRRCVAEYRVAMELGLAEFQTLNVFPGRANYVLVQRRDGGSARTLADALLCGHRIAIRVCDNYTGLDDTFFRVAVRGPEETERFLEALDECLEQRRPGAKGRRERRTPALMIQGTTSNAGKSVIAAAFCRVLVQDGVRVAPFKAQNMSLNSFVTRDGGEMGRAQVVQAQACRLDPEVRMNPILLKPNSDTGSQVILMGSPIGNMNVMSYTERKAKLRSTVQEVYDSLAGEFDAVILEGAGSPAEVNLKKRDLVNMQMARHAESPALVVGDIDRGGVYAAFIGTLAVMEEWERRLVAGFLVNRFRGNASLLQDAHDYVLNYTGKPVLGVVPYLPSLNLPEEDSVEFKNGESGSAATRADAVEIAVIDLPHISNFTDFDAFRLEPDVSLRVVRRGEDLGHPDAVILPGSRNVPGDLAALQQSGLAESVRLLADKGRTVTVGICGGLQMLGHRIADPHGLEAGSTGCFDGLGLLPVSTTFAREKTLTRSEGHHPPSGSKITGYEIHHGITEVGSCAPMFLGGDGEQLGVRSEDGGVWGSYLHGVFDADGFRRVFIDGLRSRKGLAPLRSVQASYGIEEALDRLADVLREAVDMDAVYQVMGL